MHTYDYPKFMKRTFASNWFPVPRTYLQTLSPSESIVVFSLLNFSKAGTDANGWIPLPGTKVGFLFGMAAERFEKTLERLKKKGILETKTAKGLLHLRIDCMALEQLTHDRKAA